jgi:hypothetical protein
MWMSEDTLRARGRVRVATNANINIASRLVNGQAVDGVQLNTNDLVLVRQQTNAAQNGVYVVLATAGTPLRFTEYDACAKLASELFTVSEGTEWQGTHWRCDAQLSGTINTTAVPFQLVDDIGSLNILTPADLDAGVTAARPLRNLQVNAREMTNVHLIGLTENAVPAIDAAANEFATLTANDALPLVIDGALRQINPVALQEFVLGTPWKLDATGELDTTAVIQAKADALLVYAEVTGFGANATTDIVRPVGVA